MRSTPYLPAGRAIIIRPLLLAAAVCVLDTLLPGIPRLLGEGGLVRTLVGIVAVLAGLALVALVVAATFGGPGLDAEIAARHDREPRPAGTTPRMVLTAVLAYVAAASILACGVCLLWMLVEPSLALLAPSIGSIPYVEYQYWPLRLVMLGSITLPIAAMMVGTLQAISCLARIGD
ncbi:hypothetical protein [Labrys wisconsinensis]|uniref:Uncharacterized protein n=1 Tax=Labrys wisconsinensis TaxID=425677 RepID=A0ABU0JJU8_9HYPH|nr:hypothetical protein [Labrys wisconsinensis]MDQ0474558.1 hypothetical protein [Labrys wisconsinensis]